MSRNFKEFEEMTEFEKWLFYVKGENGKWYTPTLAKFGTDKEEEAAKYAWRAALEWIRKELYEVRAHGFEPDLGLYNLLKKELEDNNAKT